MERRIIIKLRGRVGERCRGKGAGEGKRIAEEGRLDFFYNRLNWWCTRHGGALLK